MKKCLLCGNTIPRTRKKSAKYCSDECYYLAKLQRSNKRYHWLKEPHEEIKRNESILAFLYNVAAMNKPIYADDLSRCKFNFSLSTGEHLDDKKRLFKKVGNYAYYIEPSKNIIIWKSK